MLMCIAASDLLTPEGCLVPKACSESTCCYCCRSLCLMSLSAVSCADEQRDYYSAGEQHGQTEGCKLTHRSQPGSNAESCCCAPWALFLLSFHTKSLRPNKTSCLSKRIVPISLTYPCYESPSLCPPPCTLDGGSAAEPQLKVLSRQVGPGKPGTSWYLQHLYQHLTPKVRTFLWEQECHRKLTLFS